MPVSKSVRRASRLGFTLIELVVVIIIIATIAGFVIPQIGMLGRTSDMAATAKTQADIASNIQLYFTLQKRYPQGLDSLLDGSGALYAPPGASVTEATQVYGMPVNGAGSAWLGGDAAGSNAAQLSVAALTGDTLKSLTRSGFDYVYDHSTSVVNSNNSATAQRYLIANGATAAPTSVNVAEVTGAVLLGRLVPQGLASTERVIAMGVGPKNAAISKTLTNSPIYPGCDGKYYGRYIVYFKVYSSGERATLVGVSDSYGRTPDYSQQQFNESLPDGGRQG